MSDQSIALQPILDVLFTTLANLVVLAGLPFAIYFAFQKLRKKRRGIEIAKRAGLQLGEAKYIGYSLVVALGIVAYFVFWPPSAEPFVREGSAQSKFDGLGLGATSLAMALMYGVIATGFCEELFFRGLIAGSLSRRLPMIWANLVQAIIFLLPHLLLLMVMKEMWPILLLVFAAGLFAGWLRIKSGSILSPWLIHATANVAMCLHVAIQTAA